MAVPTYLYKSWPVKEHLVFVHCAHTEIHGEDSLQPATVKFECANGHDFVELVDKSERNVGNLMRIMSMADSDLRVKCHVPGCKAKTGRAFFKCRGGACSTEAPRCHHTSAMGACSFLPQALPTSLEQPCAVYGSTGHEVMFCFDPCGHFVSLEGLRGQVKFKVKSGRGIVDVKKSPETEYFSFTCPMGCGDSFLHDIHHLKTLGDIHAYNHIKNWALDQLDARAHEDIGEEASPVLAPHGVTLKMVTEALTEASASRCPNCGVLAQKGSGCTHITCSCKHKYCYICSADLRCPHGHKMYLQDYAELDSNPIKAVQMFHMLKSTQSLHAFHSKYPEGFKCLLEENPELLSDLCLYDGVDEVGVYNPQAKLEGVTLTADEVAFFTRPEWLPELQSTPGEAGDVEMS